LNQGEIHALVRACEDPDFRTGFQKFCEQQANDAGGECYRAMQQVPAQIETAIGAAARARAAEECFNKLEEFTRQELAKG
jgi:hypothetical protein